MRSARASIQRHGDGWRVFVEAGRDPRTGKRRRLSKVVRGSRVEAEKVKEQLLLKAGDGSVFRESMPLGEFWEQFYIRDCEERLRPNTVEGYVKNYRQFVDGSLDTIRLDRISPIIVQDWLRGFRSDKRRFEAFKTLRQILNHAVRLDLLPSNPCERVPHPKHSQDYEPDVLNAEEAAAYLEIFRDTEIEPAVLLALGCGLRRSEIAALDWDDISDGEVSITHAITMANGKAHDDQPKSRFGKRQVRIPESIAARLEELRSWGPIVVDKWARRLSPDRISREYDKVLKQHPEVHRVPLMNLRHTSLSLAIEGGADILAVSRRGGHSNVGITSRYYLRPSSSIDDATAQALDGVLCPEDGKIR